MTWLLKSEAERGECSTELAHTDPRIDPEARDIQLGPWIQFSPDYSKTAKASKNKELIERAASIVTNHFTVRTFDCHDSV